ncbi:MAG: hypothetical protein HDQ98_02905 [Lachnospiraceae bacterium]|nr:hypothetical protein [Lachnospiraceae bacterium]
MKNRYFADEEIGSNDLFFICYMIERVARKLHQENRYVVNAVGKDAMYHLLSVANVLHAQNPLDVEDDWIKNYDLQFGNFDIFDVDKELVTQMPTAVQMGKVYQRLIRDTLLQDEDYVEGIFRVYNHEICNVIDNYNCSAYFEPSYVIARAYRAGGF